MCSAPPSRPVPPTLLKWLLRAFAADDHHQDGSAKVAGSACRRSRTPPLAKVDEVNHTSQTQRAYVGLLVGVIESKNRIVL